MLYATIRLMHLPLRVTLIIICIALLASAGSFDLVTRAQQEITPVDWLEVVNEARLDEGLNPYSQSRLLSNAAQQYADELAGSGQTDPDDALEGAAGEGLQQRVQEAGYAAWTEDGDQLVVAESVWSGQGAVQDALISLLEDPENRGNLLSDRYREIGIGIATDADGRTTCVLDFSARPNVLPIFINDGAASTENREVAIRLTNERVRPEGQGAGFMGEAIEIRMSNQPSFEELPWESWAPLVSWTLPDKLGEHTVYVQFRDAAGRTAASADSIFLGQGTPPSPTAVVLSPAPTSEPTGIGDQGTLTPEPAGTREQATPTGQPTVTSASPSEEASSSGTIAPALRATPFPTWTPLPSPEPTSLVVDDTPEAALSLPSMEAYRRPLTLVGILQGVVIVLGFWWLLRRGKSV